MAETAHPMPSDTGARESIFGQSAKASKKGTNSHSELDDQNCQDVNQLTRNVRKAKRESSILSRFEPEKVRRLWKQRWDNAPEGWRNFISNNAKVFGLSAMEAKKIMSKNETYVETPPLTSNGRLGTSLIIGFVGAFSKILMTGLNNLHMYDMDILYEAIEHRDNSLGLLTFSNHQSVVDDPFLLAAMLPSRILLNSGLMRWGLCSLDICFQSAIVSRTLRLGKALPVQRQGGISQQFLRNAAEKLSVGDWVHIFPEGRVRQVGMGYSKRGIGKLLAMTYEARQGLPLIIPMYHEGAECVMPQDKISNHLDSIIPRTGRNLFAMTGEPIDVNPIFERLMPACADAGGTKLDAAPCLRLYEEVADFMGITMRLMRAELRKRVRIEHDDIDLGDPYEFS